MKENENVTDFMHKVVSIRNNLSSAGGLISEQELVELITAKLPKSFDTTINTIINTEKINKITLDELTGLLLRQEQRNKRYEDSSEFEDAFMSRLNLGSRSRNQTRGRSITPDFRGRGRWQDSRGRGRSRDPRICFNCGRTGHISSACRIFDICYHCGQGGHYPYQCPQRRSEIQKGKRPVGGYSKEKADEDEEETAFIVALASNLKDNDTWYVDSGASRHMTSREDWFETLEPYNLDRSVELGDKYALDIKGIGTIAVNLQGNVKKIRNVLLVPDLKMNLLSVSQLSKKGLRTIFDEDGYCCILDMKKNGETVARGVRCNDLYKLLSNPVLPDLEEKACTVVKSSNKIWHLKYGHLPIETLKLMKNSKMVNGLPCISSDNFVCKSCQFGKQH